VEWITADNYKGLIDATWNMQGRREGEANGRGVGTSTGEELWHCHHGQEAESHAPVSRGECSHAQETEHIFEPVGGQNYSQGPPLLLHVSDSGVPHAPT